MPYRYRTHHTETACASTSHSPCPRYRFRLQPLPLRFPASQLPRYPSANRPSLPAAAAPAAADLPRLGHSPPCSFASPATQPAPPAPAAVAAAAAAAPVRSPPLRRSPTQAVQWAERTKKHYNTIKTTNVMTKYYNLIKQ